MKKVCLAGAERAARRLHLGVGAWLCLVAGMCAGCGQEGAEGPAGGAPGAGGKDGAGGAPSGGSGPGSGGASGGSVFSAGGSGGAPVASSGATSGGGGAAGGQAAGGGTGGEAMAGGTGGQPAAGGVASGGTGGQSSPPPRAGAQKLGESLVTTQGLTIISYGGYLNGESFQQDGIVTHGRVQFAAFWNKARHVVLAGRTLPDGAWRQLELPDYTNTEDDAHNTISIGLSPGDGTLHLAFDHHDSPLHYRRSVAGFLERAPEDWQASDFGPVQGSLSSGAAITQVTYPRFVTAPDGQSLLLNVRIGASGNGTARLFEYASTTSSWSVLGDAIDGAPVDENPYFHAIAFTPAGERLHFAWCNRATPDATTNHDLYYAYSDDQGRSLSSQNGQLVAVVGQSPLISNSTAVREFPIGQNRGLINQEHMVVDREGRVHVLLSHMPDGQPDDSDFSRARTKSEFFHYVLQPAGEWQRTALGAGVIQNFRGSLAISRAGNVYAVLPDLRLYGASLSAGFSDWKLLDEDSGRFFSDPLVDQARLLQEDVLTIVYPLKGSGEIIALDYTLN